MEFSVTAVDKFKIIKVAGKVDWENARILDREIQRVVDEGNYQIVFNLDEVSFLCSGGIGALVYNLNRVRKNGGAIYIISSSDYVNYIFETLKFDVVFDGLLFDSFEKFQEKVIEKPS
jgi:anti-anti-sigma factor